MKIRDSIRIKKKDLGEFIEVDAELRIKSVTTIPSIDLIRKALDPIEEGETCAIKTIEGVLYGEARRAFKEYEKAVLLHLSNYAIRNVKLRNELKEAADGVLKLLSIDNEY